MPPTARPHPPSVDALARSLYPSGLPHPLCVDVAREAIAADDVEGAPQRARELSRTLLTPVVNATGVLLHTNLGRAPLGAPVDSPAHTVEFDLRTGERGSRQAGIGHLLAGLCGTEAGMVVNNNAAAVLLVLAALAGGKDVPVSRGESVEIGGSFRVPEVMEQSGARLVDVGTTNRTRLDDYRRAIARPDVDAALVLKVHPSNYRVEGFVEATPIADLATLGVPVVVDIGSGLVDSSTPWLDGGPPAWLAGEPAAVQTIEAGAALVTFSGDKLFGGPQAGIIVGRADLVERCRRHPLARALRPGGLVLQALQSTVFAYLDRDVERIPFWAMVARPVDHLRRRADDIVRRVDHPAVCAQAMESLPGAGSAPGVTLPSYGVAVRGDRGAALRGHSRPVIARVRDGSTMLDLRAVDPADDDVVVEALVSVLAGAAAAPDR